MTIDNKIDPMNKCIWKLILIDDKIPKEHKMDEKFTEYKCKSCQGYNQICKGYYPERNWWE